jgi:hypothetical protein
MTDASPQGQMAPVAGTTGKPDAPVAPVPTQVPATSSGTHALPLSPSPTAVGATPPGIQPNGQTLQQALALRDIHPPGIPQLWPPAPGWWVLLVLIATALVLLSLRAWRTWRARVRRRTILAELNEAGQRAQGAALAAEVSALLKRVALARFGRAQVAPLTGPAWLDFLDRHGGSGRFTSGPGRALAEGPYAPTPKLDPAALLELARDWVERNT